MIIIDNTRFSPVFPARLGFLLINCVGSAAAGSLKRDGDFSFISGVCGHFNEALFFFKLLTVMS